IVLDDNSVSRKHAEVRKGEVGWIVRDLESTNGTYVNGVRLGSGERLLKPRDIVQFGKVAMIVELPDPAGSNGPLSNHSGNLFNGRHSGVHGPSELAPGDHQILVEAATNSSWEDAVAGVAYDRNRCPRPGEKLIALLRAGQHLARIENE